jgi:hypothetical protein
MKKLFILIVIVFLSLTFIQSKADCPPGAISYTVTFTYGSNPPCEFTITYCAFTSPGGVTTLSFDKVSTSINCLNYFFDPMFWDAAKNAMINHYLEFGEFPPCPLTTITFIAKRAICWKIHNIPEDPIHNVSGLVECINCGLIGQCIWEYIVCTDYTKTPPQNIITLERYYSIPNELCPDETPIIPPLGKTWYDEWTTECYGVSCIE